MSPLSSLLDELGRTAREVARASALLVERPTPQAEHALAMLYAKLALLEAEAQLRLEVSFAGGTAPAFA